MIKAVLLDLDNTLLRNQEQVFTREYLHLLDTYFTDHTSKAGMAQAVLRAVQVMNGERDLMRTNADIAQTILLEATQQSPQEFDAAFADFFANHYPALRRCTEPVAVAPDLVAALQQQGYAVVIATNPLYPAEAIRQRLAWANLPADLSAYAFVTHTTSAHFTKPDPALYAEIVARVSVEPDEAIMVGDSLRNDLQPARQTGLFTFAITDEALAPETADGAGTLNDFYNRVTTSDWLNNLTASALQPAMIAPELRGNVAALFGTLADAKPHYWTQHPAPQEWSLIQIVCHLLTSEQMVHRPRLERIKAEDNPFIASVQPVSGAPCDDDGLRAARQFAQERHITRRWLSALDAGDWSRPARHSVFGLTTLLEMAHFTAQHDRLHINQLCQTLGRCI